MVQLDYSFRLEFFRCAFSLILFDVIPFVQNVNFHLQKIKICALVYSDKRVIVHGICKWDWLNSERKQCQCSKKVLNHL